MGVFKRNQAFFRTNVILSEGTLAECILFPWYQSSPDGFEIVLPEHVCRNSHMAKANERWFKTRMKAIVSNKPGEPVDLFDLSWEEGGACVGVCTSKIFCKKICYSPHHRFFYRSTL
jgi:hypothetical protein